MLLLDAKCQFLDGLTLCAIISDLGIHVCENLIFDTMNLTDNNREKLIELCEDHRVRQLYLFGSILTDRFLDSSDVDILVQFREIELEQYFDNYMDFKEKLEELFKRQVDLVENQAIRNPIFRQVVDREKLLVYERKTA